jgi:hypothetical protein
MEIVSEFAVMGFILTDRPAICLIRNASIPN